ncbi:hypothetical protein BH11ACT8_BH11ACT8_02230 [soil metagenome]
MATSRGVTVGSTDAATVSACPGSSFDGYGQMTVSVAEGVPYVIAADGSGYIADLVLLSRAKDCAGQ